MFIDRKTVMFLRTKYSEGTRVRLVRMNDPQAPPPGTEGTVKGVDDIGSIMVAWDNGSGLNVAYGEDKCEIIGEEDYPRPTQVIFYDPELDEEHAGIAYNNKVIGLYYNRTYELPEVEIRMELPWKALEENCFGY